ncbi:hypothetical protein GCM10009125_16140 [Castellaniella daejeonensis]|uniref:Uncharacterized protein n=1 Tax=Castellaniella daejeonensis TaxID=659013 RepID=A0ABP3DB39_9BURK
MPTAGNARSGASGQKNGPDEAGPGGATARAHEKELAGGTDDGSRWWERPGGQGGNEAPGRPSACIAILKWGA